MLKYLVILTKGSGKILPIISMTGAKATIMAQLKKELLPLTGFNSLAKNTALDASLGPIKNAFPQASFPLGAIHEFMAASTEDAAATNGFVAGILSLLMQNKGASIWVSASRTIFPPALQALGISPEKIIFIDLKKESEILWVMEEALKCAGLFAVIGEMRELSFTASRRLQLAVEKSQVTGFVLRQQPRNVSATACITRWKITAQPTELAGNMPGVGFPRWNVELMKVRNGRPGNWQIEYGPMGFRQVSKLAAIVHQQQRKTG